MRKLKRILSLAVAGVMTLTMLTACGGGSSTTSITAKYTPLINSRLSEDENSFVASVTASETLGKEAAQYAEILKGYVKPADEANPTAEETANNNAVDEKEGSLHGSLKAANKSVYLTEQDNDDDYAADTPTDQELADKTAGYLNYMEENWNQIPVSIGIAEVSGYYPNGADGNPKTLKGWVVIVSYK